MVWIFSTIVLWHPTVIWIFSTIVLWHPTVASPWVASQPTSASPSALAAAAPAAPAAAAPAGPPAVVPAGPVMPPATDATAPDADADARVAASPDAAAPDATAPACAPMAPAAAPAATPAAVPAAPGAAPTGALASVPAVFATPVADEPATAAPAAPAVREEGTAAAAASDVEPRSDQDDLSAPKHVLHAATVLRAAVGPKHRFRIRMDDGVCSVQCMLQECIDKGVAQCVKCGVEGRALINFSKDHLGYQKRSGIQIEKMANVHRKAVGLASADSASAAGTVGADVDDDVTQMTAESAATVKATRAGSDKERRSSVLGDVELRTSAPPADADERSEGATSRAASSGKSGVDHFRQSQRAQEPWTVDYEVRTHNGAPWLFCLVCSMPKIRCETAPYRVESGAKQHRGITGLSEGCVRKSVPRSERDITSFIQKRV